jgi:hypothetical protein
MVPKDEVNRICDRVRDEVLALFVRESAPAEAAASPPEWLTVQQLAEHWQLRNGRGQLTTSGILKWTKRDIEEFPLPHAYMGDLIRFHRTEVDQWARDEAQRRRTGRKTHAPGADLTSTVSASSSRLPRTLTAVGSTQEEEAYASV